MTEQEELWAELENAKYTMKLPKKNNKNESTKPDQCSFCHAKTKKLTHEVVGNINVYLCDFCMEAMRISKKRLNGEADSGKQR